MNNIEGEKKAIKLGRDYAKNSKDKSHDIVHLESVEKHAFAIWNNLEEEGKLSRDVDKNLDRNLVLIAVWWHDVFKMIQTGISLYDSLFREGRISSGITRKKLKKYVSENRLEEICIAIEYHNKPLKYVLNRKKLPSLVQILIEADYLDMLRKGRMKQEMDHFNGIFSKIIIFLNYVLSPIALIFILKASYSRKFFFKNFLAVYF